MKQILNITVCARLNLGYSHYLKLCNVSNLCNGGVVSSPLDFVLVRRSIETGHNCTVRHHSKPAFMFILLLDAI